MPTTASDNPLTTYASAFIAFAADLHVPLGAASGRLADNWAQFQVDDFAAIAPALEAVAAGRVAPIRRHWWERTKGASKDSDCAVAILWLLAFAPRAIRVQVGAYDREQASELRYIIKAILSIEAPLNRLLAEVVEVQAARIVAHAGTAGRPESVCEILTTDAFGSHGSRPDVVIANELSHVGSQSFMETLFDNADIGEAIDIGNATAHLQFVAPSEIADAISTMHFILDNSTYLIQPVCGGRLS